MIGGFMQFLGLTKKVFLFCIVQACVCADVQGMSFESKRLYLLDEVKGNYLFRGNLPENDGKFCYDELVATMSDLLKSQGKKLPSKFKLLDFSFLTYSKDRKDIDIEKDWCKDNPKLGTFYLNPLSGSSVNPVNLSESKRDYTLKHQDIDGLTKLLNELHKLLKSKANSPVVIYIHCSEGKDRTGEASASYLMKHKKFSYNAAVALNKKIADRDLEEKFMNAIRWYAFYLRDNQKFTTIGSIDGK